MKDEDCLPELVSLENEQSDDDVEAEGMQKDHSIYELKSLVTDLSMKKIEELSKSVPEPSWVRSAYGDNIDEKEDSLPELVAKITVKPLSDCIVDEYEEDKMILLPCNKCHKIKKTNRCSNCKSGWIEWRIGHLIVLVSFLHLSSIVFENNSDELYQSDQESSKSNGSKVVSKAPV